MEKRTKKNCEKRSDIKTYQNSSLEEQAPTHCFQKFVSLKILQ
jgi:hypothetical protein